MKRAVLHWTVDTAEAVETNRGRMQAAVERENRGNQALWVSVSLNTTSIISVSFSFFLLFPPFPPFHRGFSSYSTSIIIIIIIIIIMRQRERKRCRHESFSWFSSFRYILILQRPPPIMYMYA